MKINAFSSYHAALVQMAEYAIMDRITFLDAQPKLHEMSTEEEAEELKGLIRETTLEIADFKKIQAYARTKLL